MKLTKKERDLLVTVSSLVEKLLDGGAPEKTARGVKAAKTAKKARKKGKRLRRTASDAGKLRLKVIAARKRKVPVKQIAEDLGVTTSYIYQIASKDGV